MKRNSTVVTMREHGSTVKCSGESGDMHLAHGMVIGSVPELSEEQREIVIELMKGYSDYLEERYD